MIDCLPFFLIEAEIALYPANADGTPNTDAPYWFGCCARNLDMVHVRHNVKIARTGARTPRSYTTNEEHMISIARVWAVERSTQLDFVPTKNQRFVMQITWHDRQQDKGYQRVYSGVTAEEFSQRSNGVLESNAMQQWRAETMEQSAC